MELDGQQITFTPAEARVLALSEPAYPVDDIAANVWMLLQGARDRIGNMGLMNSLMRPNDPALYAARAREVHDTVILNGLEKALAGLAVNAGVEDLLPPNTAPGEAA